MNKNKYVVLLMEKSVSGYNDPEMGYWDGKIYRSGDGLFVGALDDYNDERVKKYTSVKYAEKAANKLPLEVDQVASAKVITIN